METLFRNSRIKLSQGLLFWREVGEGIPVIFLHGSWNEGSQWVPIMESLSREFHCLTPDLLGFGESEIPDIHYSIDLQVECLAEFLQALRLENVYLVGHSLGGWVAASYALKYPDNVKGLVLLAPEGVATEVTEKHLKQMRNLLQRSEFMFALLRLLRPIAKLFGWQINVNEEWKLRRQIEEYPTACELLYQRQKAEIYAEYLETRLHLLQAPSIILQGGKDSPEALAASQVYAKSIPGANFQTIAHGENNLPEKCSLVVAEEIRDFIKSY
ncbi:alpha/beta hydrolase [Calothrix sp. UHCC 0171]|uniref:alpha/beta fold hydrolase n=1 Tax=Calothrix sp. UHCC 0171 TaxID=3110245 RepID=UPI002B1EE334|nr:alpha/beta hydrolase [Calothrix sp. UHCC 0171]MEA5569655.1 alpha/beta hydrolase [Calothrix sp. UHCC 0171]